MEGNVLANRSSENRKGSDYYPTPEDVTQALITFLQIPKTKVIWEPACGEGFMSNVFQKNGYTVISTDLNVVCADDKAKVNVKNVTGLSQIHPFPLLNNS